MTANGGVDTAPAAEYWIVRESGRRPYRSGAVVMSTIANPQTLADLLARVAAVRPDSQRRWGTLTPGEMLCHLADASDSVLGRRVPPGPPSTDVPRPVLKWLALYTPLSWPKGAVTRPGVDPHRDGTKPTAFDLDRDRVVTGLRDLAVAPPKQLLTAHSRFGPMSRADWHRWAYRQVDHHLRQFGH